MQSRFIRKKDSYLDYRIKYEVSNQIAASPSLQVFYQYPHFAEHGALNFRLLVKVDRQQKTT